MTYWHNLKLTDSSKKYLCPWCDSTVSANESFLNGEDEVVNGFRKQGRIYICPHCSKPTYFNHKNDQAPKIKYGDNVSKITDEFVNECWDEVRSCMQVSAYTAAAIMCRKIIMNVAIHCGFSGGEGKKFIDYVNYFEVEKILGKDSKNWVNKIRIIGNDANHKQESVSEENAKEIVRLTTMLLKIVYELSF